MSEYPEHDKVKRIADKSQIIGEFVDWCADEKGLTLYDRTDDVSGPGIQKLLAAFFEIDLDKLEAEKDAMLAKLREADDA